MKSAMWACFVLAAFVSFTAYAQESRSAEPFTKATIEQTEKSLLKALNSNSEGLQISAALTVRELVARMPERSFSQFVIPLMRVMKDESVNRCSRVVAAIALHDLHSAIGDYAIARMPKFTDCMQLQRACNWLAYYQLLEDHPELAPKTIDTPVTAQAREVHGAGNR